MTRKTLLAAALFFAVALAARAQESNDATSMPPAEKIIDQAGATYTLRMRDRAVLQNGGETGAANILEVWYLNHLVWTWSGVEWKQLVAVPPPLPPGSNWPPNSKPTGLPNKAGLRMPVGPQDNVPCTGENLKPGDNVGDIVMTKPDFTTFCFAAGVYKRATVWLRGKKGMQFIGAKGAIWDGEGVEPHAIAASDGNSPYTVVKNLVFRNYGVPVGDAAIQSWSPYWQVQQNEISGSTGGAGVWVSSYGLVIGNDIHDNAQEGYRVLYDADMSKPAVGVTFDSNHIHHNNPAHGWNDENGGGKALNTEHLSFWYNDSHDNIGPGYWTDWNNIWTIYWFNKATNNSNGIEHEISYNASIIGNELVDNGNSEDLRQSCTDGYFTCGAVVIEDSSGVNGADIEIANNKIVSGKYGRALAYRSQDRGAGPHGPFLIRNVAAHHNQIDMSHGVDQAQVGAVSDWADAPNMFAPSANIRFDLNSYGATETTGWFTWNNAGWWMTWSAWQAIPHDRSSTMAGNPPTKSPGKGPPGKPPGYPPGKPAAANPPAPVPPAKPPAPAPKPR